MKRILFPLALFLAAGAGASAEERVPACFNDGRYSQAEIVYGDAQLGEVAALVAAARDAAEELAAWLSGASPDADD